MILTLACSALAETEITFWHTYSEGEEKTFLEQVLPAFEAAYPEIKVNPIRMPYEGLNQQIITAVAGETAPDLVRMDITWVAQFAKLGALQPIYEMEGAPRCLPTAARPHGHHGIGTHYVCP
jgi:multiple sugar transport system substrate-binding protein